jgi:alanine-synthesizing transaminase
VLDLTVSNPTAAGLPYPRDAILGALASPDALLYSPDPFGLRAAREAVSAELASHGTPVPSSRIALTASTSEAYAVLFKLLCDPGDEVLVPTPSYPLLDWLASYESIVLRPYPLVYAGRWHVDLEALRAAVTPRTRAIVVVAPNNPTGSYLGREELEGMLDLGLPIVSDEVFARYPLTADGRIPEDRVPSVLSSTRGLVFSLAGLSKLAALPQLKLGWIAASGDEERVRDALAHLELVLDAYLSVGAPVQHAVRAILATRHVTTDAISLRTRRNLATLRKTLADAPAASLLDVEGGWYATIRVPDTTSDEERAVRLLEESEVFVHPGYFFDMHRGAHLVVSLLTPEATFAEGAARLAAHLATDA